MNIAKKDLNIQYINNIINNTENNIKNTFDQIKGGNSKCKTEVSCDETATLEDYEEYYKKINNEKDQQIKILKIILDYLEQLNKETNKVNSLSNKINNDIDQIKQKIIALQK
tara:strand:- start:193 stop:528 length:336 start_codon:yes stop_codon:yes gene_type:complete